MMRSDRRHVGMYLAAVVFLAGACTQTVSIDPPPAGTGTGSTSGAGGAASSSGAGGAASSSGASSSMAGSGSAGTGGGCGNGGSGPTRSLKQVLAAAPWNVGQNTAGMAVDAQENVYLADANDVFVTAGANVDVYMTAAEASAIPGQMGLTAFRDLDRGPDGKLYLLTDSSILQSGAAHQGTLLRTLSGIIFPTKMSVVSESLITLVNSNGMYLAKPGGNNLLYGSGPLLGGTNCATEDLAVEASGVFVYQPGCNGSPIVRGNVDGSGVDALFQWVPGMSNALHVQNFLCSARDPAGGFYTMIEDDDTWQPRLVHFDSCFTGNTGFHDVQLSPSLAAVAAASMNVLAFRYCSIAVSPAGAIFIQTFDQLWRVDP